MKNLPQVPSYRTSKYAVGRADSGEHHGTWVVIHYFNGTMAAGGFLSRAAAEAYAAHLNHEAAT